VPEESTTEEKSSVVRFLGAQMCSMQRTHKEIFRVCGGKCLSGKSRSQLGREIPSRTFESRR
jgi:hypothetical protein